ncbi:hypothetical protein Ssi02_66070 [Sinosporangium siamense]|uniref:Uncharacterized protein n=1 Tax=Sinosporangium siamense TaxID=1367973 RepID=A0A919VAE2_9ACTN|nr:hypothetical protein Ssi02_66070 [Sinosporangium siamense]
MVLALIRTEAPVWETWSTCTWARWGGKRGSSSLIDTQAMLAINKSATGQNFRTVTYPTDGSRNICLSQFSVGVLLVSAPVEHEEPRFGFNQKVSADQPLEF